MCFTKARCHIRCYFLYRLFKLCKSIREVRWIICTTDCQGKWTFRWLLRNLYREFQASAVNRTSLVTHWADCYLRQGAGGTEFARFGSRTCFLKWFSKRSQAYFGQKPKWFCMVFAGEAQKTYYFNQKLYYLTKHPKNKKIYKNKSKRTPNQTQCSISLIPLLLYFGFDFFALWG